ncbi:GntR family transcriptional regulator [Amycolatopsis jiangsuensis]|uniref:DNA-binding GntR family transcriptional regulator n=1 Tax=Amycolatopsis jiangsuensis TaxID=1181879 RepID=A0A840IY64_9PSEU|nr:GntR family transcriptional regulator [Amycolatopsis jiangsuensis]MBB4686790.1 DNA-binding GntR family transcriptional regulator [Amycolatopsis jiangsuensis]
MATDAPAEQARTSKSQLAYEWLRERIVSHRFTPGYRLVLSQIAAELGISTVPVREAVRRLEAEGLVTFEKNIGAQVALVDEGEYATTMQTLAVVEGAATGFSAPLLTAEDLTQARAVNQQMRECLEHFDPRRFTDLNEKFHAVLFQHCPNPSMTDLVHRGWSRLRMLRDSIFGFVPGRAVQSVAEHDHIVDLIESGADPIDVELAVRRHRTETLDAFLHFQHVPADG